MGCLALHAASLAGCQTQPPAAAQVSNATTVHVRKPGNSRKWRAHVLCEAKVCDLALLSVTSSEFWADDFLPLHFVDVPELQVGRAHSSALHWARLQESSPACPVTSAAVQTHFRQLEPALLVPCRQPGWPSMTHAVQRCRLRPGCMLRRTPSWWPATRWVATR